MKQGWEIKKLGEVCEVLDSQRKPVTKKDRKEGSYPYYGATGIQDYVDSYIFDGRYLLVGEDGAKWGSNDKTAFVVDGKCWVNNHAHILKLYDNVIDSFAEYYLVYKDLNEYITGAIVQKLTQKALVSIPIPIPPLPEQEKIVSELDCLSGIIEKKRQQLKELDALAQSIFYEMFGDTVGNEKGWEVKKLGEVGELARGVSKHRPRNAPKLLGGNIPLIQTGDVANSGMYITCYNSTYSELGLSQSRLWPKGTLCITIAATIGKCSILTFDSCFPDSVVGYIVDTKWVNNEYIYYIFNRMQAILEENAPAVAQKNINLQVLNSLLLPIPPLPLQQTFASKIEAIEKQKALIKQSLGEVETLFNARMQEYFD